MRGARLAVLVSSALIVAACAPGVRTIESARIDGDVTVPADTGESGADEPLGPADRDALSYRFVLQFSGTLDGEPFTLDAEGAHDPDTGDTVVVAGVDDLIALDATQSLGDADPTAEVIEFAGGGSTWSRGLVPELGYPDEIDATVWYETAVFDMDERGLLGPEQFFDDVRRVLEPLGVTEIEPSSPSESAAIRVETDPDTAAEILDIERVLLSGPVLHFPVSATLAADLDGRVGRVQLAYEWEDSAVTMTSTFTDFGEPLDLPVVTDPQPLPLELDEVIDGDDAIRDDDAIGEHDVIGDDDVSVTAPDLATSPTLRIYTHSSSRVGADDVKYVLEPDGDILRIRNGNIFTGPSGYETWSIGPNGYAQIVDHLASTRMMGASVRRVDTSIPPAGAILADGFSLFVAHGLYLPESELTPDQFTVRREFANLLYRLADMSWLTDTTVTEPVPWVPSHLTVIARNEHNPRYYTTEDIEWPFERSIDEMTSAEIDGAGVICLTGADAATAWRTLLIDGVNNARIPVTDGRAVYEMGLRISYPTYAAGTGSCPVVTELDTPTDPGDEAIRLPEHIVDPLLFTTDDLDSSWLVGDPDGLPEYPDVPACPGAPGPAAAAVRVFDGWMTRTVTAGRADFTELFQLVGFGGRDDDVDAIVDAIAPFDDCPAPFTDLGIAGFDSFDLVDLPPRVTSGAVWTFTQYGQHVAVADIALDGRLVMVIRLSGPEPLGADDLAPLVERAAANLDRFEQALADCAAAGEQARSAACRQLDEW